MERVQRRALIVSTGSLLAVALSGCTVEEPEEAPAEEPPDDDETPTPEDEEEEETPTPEEEEEDVEDDDDPEMLPEEPDYGDFFDDVDNYEGTFDFRGVDEVLVHVGEGPERFDFEPAAIAVSPGTTVTWEWTGEGGVHNVVEVDTAFESDLVDEAGYTFEHAFEEEEEEAFLYICEPHEAVGMKGAVVVLADNGEGNEDNGDNDETDDAAEDAG